MCCVDDDGDTGGIFLLTLLHLGPKYLSFLSIYLIFFFTHVYLGSMSLATQYCPVNCARNQYDNAI